MVSWLVDLLVYSLVVELVDLLAENSAVLLELMSVDELVEKWGKSLGFYLVDYWVYYLVVMKVEWKESYLVV